MRKLPAQIAIYRAALAQARGDVAGTVQYAQQAFDRLQAGDHLGRGGAAGFLGLALWASGDLGAAQRTFADAMTSLQLAGNLADAISGVVVLADLQIGQGRLREARRILEQAAQMAAAQGAPAPQATGDLYVGLSELLCEHNDLAAATEQLLKSQALGERASLSENRYRWPVAMARIRAAQGDPDAALDWLDQAQHLYLRGFYPEVRPIAAMQARIWLAQGRLAQAQAWAQARGLTVADEPSYLREFEHLTLARLRIAQSRAGQARGAVAETLGLLARLLTAAEAGGRTGSVIEILALQALAHAAPGHVPQALAALAQALAQAEPEGYVRLFVDEGPPMAALLEGAVKGGIAPNYVRRLLAAFGKAAPTAGGPGQLSAAPQIPEPLSGRELDVLRLLRTELSGPEIAQKLMVSANTFHTHTRNIYGKLGVKNRQDAVRRAEDLNLFNE